MAPADRKAYTDAVKCLMSQPSQLNQSLYSGAINRFFDYATIHINRTQTVHLDAFFLPWHRMFVWLFEQDLKHTCGYNGTQPYWNWPATAYDLENSPIFNGDEYSMSGNGIYEDTGPLVLAPTFQLPKGTGGGCVTNGPFAGMNYTMQPISIQLLIQGGALPPTAFTKNESCLTRDLNSYVAQTQTNWTIFDGAVAAANLSDFDVLLNGVIGGGVLGLHSGAHFTLGAPASNIFASAQDPIWYPLHTFLDVTYVQWQKAHPDLANSVFGTITANNVPPSDNATIDTVTPDWGYFHEGLPISDLISTTAGPFCYQYDFEAGPYTE